VYCPDCGPANVHLGDEFARIQSDLVGKMESSQFPLIAARLLLADNLTDYRLLAEDRASCEAWAMALVAAIGSVAPEYVTNPLTGEAYQLLRQTDSIAVWGAPAGSDRRAAVVKIRAAGSEERVAGSDRLRLENRPPSRSSDSLTSVNYQLCWCEPKRLRRFFNTSSTRKRVNFETPMIHSLARRVGIVAPFRGLPRTTGSAGGK